MFPFEFLHNISYPYIERCLFIQRLRFEISYIYEFVSVLKRPQFSGTMPARVVRGGVGVCVWGVWGGVGWGWGGGGGGGVGVGGGGGGGGGGGETRGGRDKRLIVSYLLIKSPQYTGGDFMFLYRFVRRRRRRRRRRPQILVHVITFEQLFGFFSFLAQLLALTCRLPD